MTFSKTYTGNWNPGQPYDYVTVAPDGSGETFAGAGIDIRVYLKNCAGDPLVGVPAQEIVVFNSGLCICPGGNISDAGTDTNGCATFSGTLNAGGCATTLDVYADGVFICQLEDENGTTVKVNSTDHIPASPCFTDAGDLSAFTARFGDPALYDICFDYNESGPPTINASDLSYFASVLGANCQ